MGVYQLLSDFAMFCSIMVIYTDINLKAHITLIKYTITNRVIFLTLLVFVFVPFGGLSNGAFLAILPFTAWPSGMYGFFIGNTDPKDTFKHRARTTFAFCLIVIVIAQLRLWIILGSVAAFNQLAKTTFYLQNQDNIVFLAAYAIFFDVVFGLAGFIPRLIFTKAQRREQHAIFVKHKAARENGTADLNERPSKFVEGLKRLNTRITRNTNIIWSSTSRMPAGNTSNDIVSEGIGDIPGSLANSNADMFSLNGSDKSIESLAVKEQAQDNNQPISIRVQEIEEDGVNQPVMRSKTAVVKKYRKKWVHGLEDHMAVFADERFDVIFFASATLFFSNYGIGGTQSVLRAPSYPLFLIMTLFDTFSEMFSHLYEFYKLRMYDELTVFDENALPLVEQAEILKRGSIAPEVVPNKPKQSIRTQNTALMREAHKKLSYSTIVMARWLRFKKRRLNREDYIKDKEIIERRYRRMAVILRYSAAGTIITSTLAFAFVALYVSPQPAFERCNGLWYISLSELTGRYLLVIGVQFACYTLLFWYLRFFTTLPLGFSKKISADTLQGVFGAVAFCGVVGLWLFAYETGLVNDFDCGIETIVPYI